MPKREEILKAVISLSDKCAAPADLTISTIAEHAGVGKGTVYEYFSSKEEILAEAVGYFIDTSLSPLTGMTFHGSFREGFDQIVEEVGRIVEHHHSFFQMVFLSGQLNDFDSRLTERYDAKFEPLLERLACLIERLTEVGKAEGIVTGNPSQDDMLFSFICIAVAFGCTTNGPPKLCSAKQADGMKDFLFGKFIKLLN